MIGIIGCGASGMMAAICAARAGRQVTVLEHNDRPGRKLAVTGNGHCNLTNDNQTQEAYRTADPEIASRILATFSKEELLAFFRQIGVLTREKNGYWYPYSGNAQTVVAALSAEMKRLGVRVLYGADTQSVIRLADGRYVVRAQVGSEMREMTFDRLVLACGGPAGDKLGQSDFGFRALRRLSVAVSNYAPALVPLQLDNPHSKMIAGVRMEAEVTLRADGAEHSERGEIVWTEYGVSGIPVMQVSRFASMAFKAREAASRGMDSGAYGRYAADASGRESGPVTITIRLMPDHTAEQIREITEEMLTSAMFASEAAASVLGGMADAKIVRWILLLAGVPEDAACKEISPDTRAMIADMFTRIELPVTGVRTYAQAQTTCGGVPLTEINPETMESYRCRGLYITGELLDVDGTCGGYNLHWAFATGAAAGRALGENR